MRGAALDESAHYTVKVVSTKKKKKKKKKKKTRNVDIEDEDGPSSLPRYGTPSSPAPILTARDSKSEGGRSSLLQLPSAKSPAMRVAQTVDADDWMVGSTSPERTRFIIPERTKHGRSRPMTREKAKRAAPVDAAVVEDDGNRMLSISMPDRGNMLRGSSAIWGSRERALMASATADAEAQAAAGDDSPADRSRGGSISSDDARTPRTSAIRFATPTGVSSPVSPPGIRRFDDVPSLDAAAPLRGSASGGGASGGASRSRVRSRSRSGSSGPPLPGVPELPEGVESATRDFECIVSRRLVQCTFGTRAAGSAPYATVTAALSGWTSVLMSSSGAAALVVVGLDGAMSGATVLTRPLCEIWQMVTDIVARDATPRGGGDNGARASLLLRWQDSAGDGAPCRCYEYRHESGGSFEELRRTVRPHTACRLHTPRGTRASSIDAPAPEAPGSGRRLDVAFEIESELPATPPVHGRASSLSISLREANGGRASPSLLEASAGHAASESRHARSDTLVEELPDHFRSREASGRESPLASYDTGKLRVAGALVGIVRDYFALPSAASSNARDCDRRRNAVQAVVKPRRAHCDDDALHLVFASDGEEAKSLAQRRRRWRQRCCFRVTSTVCDAAGAEEGAALTARRASSVPPWSARAAWREASVLSLDDPLVAAVESRGRPANDVCDAGHHRTRTASSGRIQPMLGEVVRFAFICGAAYAHSEPPAPNVAAATPSPTSPTAAAAKERVARSGGKASPKGKSRPTSFAEERPGAGGGRENDRVDEEFAGMRRFSDEQRVALIISDERVHVYRPIRAVRVAGDVRGEASGQAGPTEVAHWEQWLTPLPLGSLSQLVLGHRMMYLVLRFDVLSLRSFSDPLPAELGTEYVSLAILTRNKAVSDAVLNAIQSSLPAKVPIWTDDSLVLSSMEQQIVALPRAIDVHHGKKASLGVGDLDVARLHTHAARAEVGDEVARLYTLVFVFEPGTAGGSVRSRASLDMEQERRADAHARSTPMRFDDGFWAPKALVLTTSHLLLCDYTLRSPTYAMHLAGDSTMRTPLSLSRCCCVDSIEDPVSAVALDSSLRGVVGASDPGTPLNDFEAVVLAGRDPRDAEPTGWSESVLSTEKQQRWRLRFGSAAARERFESAVIDARETVLRGRRGLAASVFRL